MVAELFVEGEISNSKKQIENKYQISKLKNSTLNF
jgi:hypothetical protein